MEAKASFLLSKIMTKPRNLFSFPSVLLAVLGTGFMSFKAPMDTYFDTGEIQPRELQRALFYTAAALVASASLKYNESRDDEGIYTPRGLPGRDRVDVYLEEDDFDIDDIK